MLHTLMRALLVPIIAITCLIVFWLAVHVTAAQANSHNSLALPLSSVQVPTNQNSVETLSIDSQRSLAFHRSLEAHKYLPRLSWDKTFLGSAITNATVSSVTASETPAIYKIYPMPREKALEFFAIQPPARTEGAAILFVKTVGTDSDICFEDEVAELIIEPQTVVTYCYIVRNTGTVTLTQHTVVDEQLGTLVTNYPYTLTPYGTENDAAYIPAQRMITTTTMSSATWAAKTGQTVVSASDKTNVIVPTIALTTTVIADSLTCGKEKSLRVLRSTPVLYCYTLKNTGPVTFTMHTLVNSTFGTEVEGLVYPLPPGHTMTLSHIEKAIASSMSVITWTATTSNDVQIKASDKVTVQVPASLQLSAWGSLTNDACNSATMLTVNPGSQVVFCYLIRNNGGTPLQYHTISDTLGAFDTFTYTVGPGRLLGVTVTHVITQDTINTVTWTATNDQGEVASDQASVTVKLTPTAAIDLALYYDVNRDNQQHQYEFGIADAIITLTSPTGRIYTATTNNEGIAAFIHLLEPGPYTVQVDQTSLPRGYVPGIAQEEIIVPSLERRYVVAIGYHGPDDADHDNDTIPDLTEGPDDVDSDQIPNYVDLDSDNDRLPDGLEGYPDALNPAVGTVYLPTIAR